MGYKRWGDCTEGFALKLVYNMLPKPEIDTDLKSNWESTRREFEDCAGLETRMLSCVCPVDFQNNLPEVMMVSRSYIDISSVFPY